MVFSSLGISLHHLIELTEPIFEDLDVLCKGCGGGRAQVVGCEHQLQLSSLTELLLDLLNLTDDDLLQRWILDILGSSSSVVILLVILVIISLDFVAGQLQFLTSVAFISELSRRNISPRGCNIGCIKCGPHMYYNTNMYLLRTDQANTRFLIPHLQILISTLQVPLHMPLQLLSDEEKMVEWLTIDKPRLAQFVHFCRNKGQTRKTPLDDEVVEEFLWYEQRFREEDGVTVIETIPSFLSITELAEKVHIIIRGPVDDI